MAVKTIDGFPDGSGSLTNDDIFIFMDDPSGESVTKKVSLSDLSAAIETLTSISINANVLTYTDENGNSTNIDLSLYLDDTNLARLVNGSIDPLTGIGTFTRDDGTTFTVDFSSLLPQAEINDLTASVTWANVPDANITESSVVQHSGALRLTESQIVDLGNYVASGNSISLLTNDNNYIISDTTVASDSEKISNIISLSQSEYDLITPQPGVLYVIDDAPTPAISGENISQFTNDANYLTSHPPISAASSSDNSGRTYIQDIILDSNGHVTGISTATETVVNTDTDTITNIGANSTNYTNGNINFVGGGATTISKVGNTLTISSTDTNTDTNTITNIGVNNTSYTNGNINFVGGGATSISKVGNTVTITSTDTDTNTDTNNYVNGASFSNNVLTLSRLGLTNITSSIGTAGSPFGNINLAGSVIQSSEPNALYLNRTHAGGLTAMAGGTYPSAADAGMVVAYGGTHSFSPAQVHLYYGGAIRLVADINGVTVYGTFTNNSDATQKENVVPLSGCLDLVNNLNPVSFNFKPEEGLHDRTTVGFIAQEVQQTFSGLPYELGIVREIDYPTVNEDENTSKKILGISETNLVAILTKAVQELTARVEALESQLS